MVINILSTPPMPFFVITGMIEYIVHMWTHLFTLEALAHELGGQVAGAVITDVFTQRKDELLISTRSPDVKEQTIVISVHPQLNFLFFRDTFPRAKKNSVDLFPDALGLHILGVSAHPSERLLFLKLAANIMFCVRLFGTAESNVFLVDDQANIVNAFKSRKRFQGTRLDLRRAEPALPHDIADLSNILRRNDELPLFRALKSAVPFLGSTYAREILHRLRFDEKLPAGQLRPEDLRDLHAELRNLFQEARNPAPTVYLRNNEPRVFSVVPLKHLSGAQTESYDSVNLAIRSTVFRTVHSQAIENAKTRIIHRLKGEAERTLRAVAAAHEELSRTDRADTYERTANILMTNLVHLTKGTRVVELDDVLSDGQSPLRIELDPKLTPAQNAQSYFGRARRARVARTELQRRVNELQEKSARLEKLLLHIDQCHTKEQLAEFQKVNIGFLRRWMIVDDGGTDKQPPFRVFTVNGDFEVWVGKNSVNNDVLTMKYARPQDLWFHVRGAGGSHALLRMRGGKEKPSREAISQAASIAAYYSKMRKASTVPVAYCERKHIRKPKGADPGAVIMSREKVIFVEPRLP